MGEPTRKATDGTDRALSARLREGRTLLVSPHPDDVAYSCGGLLAAVGRPAHATLLTVFTRSAWALPRRLRRAGVRVISARRREEELGYCRLRGLADYRPLGFDDASLRGYDDEAEVSSPAEADELRGAVEEAITQAVRASGADTVLAPAAVGGHIDHLLVHGAVRAAVGDGDGDTRALFYEDLPYAGQYELADVERTLREERGLVPFAGIDISAVVEQKVRGMYVYGSQTDAECVRETLRHARRTAQGPGSGTVPGGAGETARRGRAAHAERVWAAAAPAGAR
ncbi:PIG-L family deacetylase [Streptomyces sp. S07_1.15]|uniref:PIG-L deacetylase family protein n=1 Tax=Streptomyces sp. S07_1.15 TaxID=2873925 RepID=UPI001D13F7D4|nr:PIG-L family deacetylase [Streptomyces sp. S07_1.15]MCC3650689.1 PIG-L family deacetylase [Streptomyces sp. S07_1.15]